MLAHASRREDDRPHAFAMFRRHLDRRLLWAVKRTSRSSLNDGFGAHTGPPRGDPRSRAFRPEVPFPISPSTDGRRHKAAVGAEGRIRPKTGVGRCRRRFLADSIAQRCGATAMSDLGLSLRAVCLAVMAAPRQLSLSEFISWRGRARFEAALLHSPKKQVEAILPEEGLAFEHHGGNAPMTGRPQ